MACYPICWFAVEIYFSFMTSANGICNFVYLGLNNTYR